jgi:signal transduction histidine kinase
VAQGHLELLESLGPADADDVRRTAAVVRRELDRLRHVLDDLIAVNRGEAGMAVRRETVFAPDLLDDLRVRVAALPHAGRIAIDPAPPVALIADQSRLEQCIANLIDNAVVHGTDTTVVAVRSFVDASPFDADRQHFVVEVSDDGPGIAPELLPHVFAPYVSTRPDRSSGTAGLGLAVVRSLVEALGGSVTARSSAAGTVMSIRLPLPSADGSAVVTDDVASRVSRP